MYQTSIKEALLDAIIECGVYHRYSKECSIEINSKHPCLRADVFVDAKTRKLRYELPEGSFGENELPSDEELRDLKLDGIIYNLIIQRSGHYGHFSVYSPCTEEYPVNFDVEVWRDSDAEDHVDLDGSSWDLSEIEKELLNSPAFTKWVLDMVLSNDSLREHMENYSDIFDVTEYKPLGSRNGGLFSLAVL